MDESKLPDSAFAAVYTNDKGTKVRKLPLYKSAGDVPNRPDSHLVAAAEAALGKGFRGNKVDLPEGARASAQAKVNAAKKKLGNAKSTSRVVLFSSSTSELEVPDSTATHFYAAGRLLSFFPTVNKNGFTFRKEDFPENLVSTLVGSLIDLQHVKGSTGITDPSVGHQTNAVIGSIIRAEASEHGIDIVTKVERDIAKSFGYTSEDFAPGEGPFSSFSQECDFRAGDTEFLVLDKSDKTKILKTLSYAEASDAGLDMSSLPNGVWDIQEIDGNPVVAACKPMSFFGAGFVTHPADSTAQVYRMASSMYPGMDGQDAMLPPEMVSDVAPNTTDLNYFSSDFMKHPDILSADVDKFYDEGDDDPKVPDHAFAATMYCSDPANMTDGKPTEKKVRLFKIKNDKGEFDRKRLIAAYHALTGLRGKIESRFSMPPEVRAFALARVRHGLKMTRPSKQMNKEISSQVNFDPNDVEALNAEIARRIEADKLVSQEAHKAVVTERDTLKDENTKLVAKVTELETALSDAKAKVAEHENKALSSERLAHLDKVLPFSDDEKSAETFAEYTKGLAAMSQESFQIAVLERTIQAKDKANAEALKAVASARNERPLTNPVPAYRENEAAVDPHILY